MNFLFLEELTSEISSEVIEAVSETSSEGASIPSAVQPVADWIKQAWEWCNQPLPIVGISLIAILVFVWRVFVSTGYGKRTIKKITAIATEAKDNSSKALEEAKAENERLRAELDELTAQIELSRGVLEKVCEASRNKSVKDLADMLKDNTEGEDTDNGGEESQEGTIGNANEE